MEKFVFSDVTHAKHNYDLHTSYHVDEAAISIDLEERT